MLTACIQSRITTGWMEAALVSHRRNFWQYWLGLLLSWLLTSAYAQPVLVSNQTSSIRLGPYLQMLVDPDSRLRIEQVSRPDWQSRFQPLPAQSGELNLGYSDASFWFRVELQWVEAVANPWLIEVDFPSLDQIELYIPQLGYQLQLGDRLPFAQRPVPNRNLLFPLPAQQPGSLWLYFRVQSDGSLTLPLKLWQKPAFDDHNQRLYASLFLYYGMLLALGLYNLMLFLSLRDPLYLAYVGFVLCMGIGQMSLYGLGNQYLWPDWTYWGHLASSSGFAAAGVFGGLFSRRFLLSHQMTPLLDKLLLLIIAAFAGAMLLPLYSYSAAAILTSLLGILFALVAELAALVCWSRRKPGAHWFVLAWSLFLVGVIVNGLRNLGWVPTHFLTQHAMQIGSALEMLLLSFALADRIDSFRRQNLDAQNQAITAQEQMLHTLKASEQQLELRVLERTIELQAMNARLAKSEAQLSYLAHHDALTGLANRLLLTEHLDRAIERSRRDSSMLAVLLFDLDGFKQVNDQLGHAVGDQLLVSVAQHLRQTLRETDTLSRMGGDEFVILAERLQSQTDLEDLAHKILLAVQDASRFIPTAWRVTASLGVALCPLQAQQPDALLRLADHAMYAAKQNGRNGWKLAKMEMDR